MQRDGCVGQHLPAFRTGQAVKMKNINYYGQKITVSDEVAEFLEQDRLRESAQRRSDQRHLDFVGNEIYTMPGLFTDEPTDPTFEQAFLLLRKHKLRKIFPTLPDDDQKLLRFYYFRFYTLEQIGKELGISKMAISKRLRKILDLLRSLVEDEAPYFSQIFLETRFTNLLCVSYKVNHKHKKALRSHSVHALHLKNLDYVNILLGNAAFSQGNYLTILILLFGRNADVPTSCRFDITSHPSVSATQCHITELTAELLHTLVEKIVAHEKEVVDGQIIMQVDIYYRFIGKVGYKNGEALQAPEIRRNTKLLVEAGVLPVQ